MTTLNSLIRDENGQSMVEYGIIVAVIAAVCVGAYRQIGLQVNKSLELTALYSHEDRAYEDMATRGNRQQGGRVRLQLQINY